MDDFHGGDTGAADTSDVVRNPLNRGIHSRHIGFDVNLKQMSRDGTPPPFVMVLTNLL